MNKVLLFTALQTRDHQLTVGNFGVIDWMCTCKIHTLKPLPPMWWCLDMAFLNVIKVRWGHVDGAQSVLIRRETIELSFPSLSLFVHTERKGHVRTQWDRGPLKAAKRKLNSPAPWIWTSSLQNCKEIISCYLSPLVLGILLWQPEIRHLGHTCEWWV